MEHIFVRLRLTKNAHCNTLDTKGNNMRKNSLIMMRIIKIFLFMSLLGFSGCTAYRNTVRECARSLGALQIRDLDEVEYIRANLPRRLDMDTKNVQVSASPHVSKVVIYGVLEKDQPTVLAQVEEFRKTSFMCYQSEPERKIPLKKIKVEFRN